MSCSDAALGEEDEAPGTVVPQVNAPAHVAWSPLHHPLDQLEKERGRGSEFGGWRGRVEGRKV